jgi:hypothetical protein
MVLRDEYLLEIEIMPWLERPKRLEDVTVILWS